MCGLGSNGTIEGYSEFLKEQAVSNLYPQASQAIKAKNLSHIGFENRRAAMEQFPITKNKDQFHIEGFQNAVKVIKIEGVRAQRLSDLALHKSDLDFAKNCLSAINHVPEYIRWPVQQALWRSAIIHYVKCFGSSTCRFQLDFKKIYKKEPAEAREAFDYFSNLRNKHFVHDENSYAQSLPGAVLNNKEHRYKIEKIVTVNTLEETLTRENYGNLMLLIEKAHFWLVSEYDALCIALANELEQQPYEALLDREAIRYSVPIDAISKPRPRARR